MKITKKTKPYLPFTVIRDSKEQAGTGWKFLASRKGSPEICKGTVISPLETGDYTIESLKDVFRVERKGSVKDLVSSLSTKRMESQMSRLSKFPHAYLVLECELEDLVQWHVYAKAMRRRGIKLAFPRPEAALSRFLTLCLKYPEVKVFFVGKRGPEFMRCLFKRVIEDHAG